MRTEFNRDYLKEQACFGAICDFKLGCLNLPRRRLSFDFSEPRLAN